MRSLSAFPVPLVVLTRAIPVDGFGALLFLRLVSQIYQGLEPLEPPPYYEPEAIKFTESLEGPSPTPLRYDPSAPPWEQPERKTLELVTFTLTATQLTEMHNSVTKGMQHLRISKVDMVAGLLARCLSEVEPESRPIDNIVYLINVRGFIAFFSKSTYIAVAPRNGCIPGQRSG